MTKKKSTPIVPEEEKYFLFNANRGEVTTYKKLADLQKYLDEETEMGYDPEDFTVVKGVELGIRICSRAVAEEIKI